MSGKIGYNPASLGDLSGNIHAQFGRLEELATSLKTQVNALADNWQSGSKPQYDDAQARWDALFMQAREQLSGLGRGVQNASDTMMNADRAIGKGFQGMV
ncbi:WXG100 family type VII secretion target [Gordonia sp. LSe1-13]|uniref:ESAT-6-like protein n=2 Tax=Gordonia TaxID=2053 RepID=A0ABU7MD73_9ACTN|nr:WXG100 family type VII secretion target [Gordonia sp. LSe1-13]MEE4021639.1 WXG100 family type VII secretion target [Gordonia sp. PKS22-38]